MAGPANVSEVINRQSGGNNGTPENVFYYKDTTGLAWTAGIAFSCWKAKGSPGIGATPAASAVPTAATAGAMRMTNPGGSRKRWLRNFAMHGWATNRVVLYDRLMHCGGFGSTTLTAQTVGTSITRYTGAESFGNIIVAEVYTTIGNAAVNLSCNYLDSTGTTRASGTVQLGGTAGKNPGDCVIIPFNTALGANSVTQVVDATLAATTGVPAGNWGITIMRPIAELVIGCVDVSSYGHGSRIVALEDIELKADACLAMLQHGPSGTSNYLRCSLSSVEN